MLHDESPPSFHRPGEDELIEMLGYREGASEASSAMTEGPGAAADWRDVISQRAYDFIVGWETGGKAYYVIVASLGTRADAQAEVRRLAKDGFGGATVLEAGDKFRVALARHDSRQAAQRQTDELKKDTRFRSAWVLPSKPDKH